MGVTTTRDSLEARPATAQRLALAVADANWFTTENLFREVPDARARTLLLQCIDYNNAFRRGLPPWAWGRALRQSGPSEWRRDLVLPSGWMKTFPKLGMRPIGRSILRWRDEHAADGRFALVMTYPHYLYLRDQVRPDRLVYFNVDDYSQYWPRQAVTIDRLERQAVREADLTVCVSPPAGRGAPRGRPRGRRPDPPPAARRPDVGPLAGADGPPRPGTGRDRPPAAPPARLRRHARRSGRLVAAGDAGPGRADRLGRPRRPPRRRPAGPVEARPRPLPGAGPTSTHVPWLPQDAIPAYNRAFDVCLIPYLVDHPFNRVCCPTKIMDYMATGRPVVDDRPARMPALSRPVRRGRDAGRVRPGRPPAGPRRLRRRPLGRASCVGRGEHVPPGRRAVPRLAALTPVEYRPVRPVHSSHLLRPRPARAT